LDDFYRRFEDRFRGSRELIKSRLTVYLPFIAPLLGLHEHASALDLGCGRGEWLELLREAGFSGLGIDIDDSMLAACRERGLRVATADAVQTLEALPDASQSIISGFHIAEHLSFQALQKLVMEAHRALKPSGLLILETPNPENIVVGACNFYLDPTHRQPIPPDLLAFVPEYYGFARTKIVRLQESFRLADDDRLTLKDVLSGVSPDYAVIAQKPDAGESLGRFDAAFSRDYGFSLYALADRYASQIETAEQHARHVEMGALTGILNGNALLQSAFLKTQAAQLNEFRLHGEITAANRQADAARQQAEQLRADLSLAQTKARQADTRAEEERAALIAELSLARSVARQAEAQKESVGNALRAELARAQATARQAAAQTETVRTALWAAQAAAHEAWTAASDAQGARDRARADGDALRNSTSWRLTRPLRVLRHLRRGNAGLALMEAGVGPQRVQRLAAAVARRGKSRDDRGAATVLPQIAQDAAIGPGAAIDPVPADAAPCDGPRAPPPQAAARRPRLAFVTPLPPERTGIADYSAAVLRQLAVHYDIDVIVSQNEVDDRCIAADLPIREVDWFRSHAGDFDRIVYQFGNSQFHGHMPELLEETGGTVVLHDFFIGHMFAERELNGLAPGCWSRELYESHGYPALQERYTQDIWQVVLKYPANRGVIDNANGVIVHSQHARALAGAWYGPAVGADWAVIPHPRQMPGKTDRDAARAALGLHPESFVVCSFGHVGITKCSHRLVDAWLDSRLARDERCMLILVGETPEGEYAERVRSTILFSTLEKWIWITGWVDDEGYRQYLAAADIAVQLRTHTRGESSLAVIDCMAHGLPTIVNAHGAMAELPTGSVAVIPDEFEDAHLIAAMEALWLDSDRRTGLGLRAAEVVATDNRPDACAQRYVAALEHFHARSRPNRALDIAASPRRVRPQQQILLDITATHATDRGTGIERVTRALVLALLRASPPGWRVEPVYLSHADAHWDYRYASGYTSDLLLGVKSGLRDEIVVPKPGDILIGLDLHMKPLIEADEAGLLQRFRAAGVRMHQMVYDLLPVQMQACFPPGTHMGFTRWLDVVTRFDGAVCGSKSVADALQSWVRANAPAREGAYDIAWSHYGADLENSAPGSDTTDDVGRVLQDIGERPCFLMVGTVEPRKGHMQALEAFEQLWLAGRDLTLVIVGGEGWKDVPQAMRRTIPAITRRLREHDEMGNRLFWFETMNDASLQKLYRHATCLIAASLGEGFGLPVIEAARHQLPVLARDIPVFREITADHASFFRGTAPDDLATAIDLWLERHRDGTHKRSDAMPWLTWRQSAENLLRIVLSDATAPAAPADASA
jgi:glycosyltransferase involved in cell wall biosynthesis/SAM-dependent methyltransferase